MIDNEKICTLKRANLLKLPLCQRWFSRFLNGTSALTHDFVLTSIRRRIDVETTSCTYREMVPSRAKHHILMPVEIKTLVQLALSIQKANFWASKYLNMSFGNCFTIWVTLNNISIKLYHNFSNTLSFFYKQPVYQ